MRIDLAYGRTGLNVELPDKNITVLEPEFIEGLSDETQAIQQALARPIGTEALREMIGQSETVAIVFSDLTRPVPNSRMLPVLLGELSHIPRENIVLINALGMHRPNTPDELVEMLGEDIVRNYRIVQHDAEDKSKLRLIGVDSSGVEVWVNEEYMAADRRILTGFIEPHFFAGFSGGPKSVLPGIAGAGLVMANHGAKNIGSPMATWGITQGNPVHDQIREAAAMTHPDFILNVALNKHKRITAVFAGDCTKAHEAGTEYVKKTAMKPVDSLFDIVLTTNSGYPLDLNLYQAVKGMTAALQVVKPQGAIVQAAECSQGLPEHGNFKSILAMADTPQGLRDVICAPGFEMFDMWEAQILARVLMKAKVYLKAGGLTPAETRLAQCIPIDSVEDTVRMLLEQYGPEASICVLPEGPQTVPYVS